MSNPYGCRSCRRNRRRAALAGLNADITAGGRAVRFANSGAEATSVLTSRPECCASPETVADEFYCGTDDSILLRGCCDPVNGYDEYNARRRCPYWPDFAHPRWLTCRELYDRRI